MSTKRSPWWDAGPTDPALVAVVTSKKDWEALERDRWYRVPVRTAPAGLERLQWIGFYQTRLFGPDKWRVNCYARVTGITTATRAELLPEEPDHPRAGHLYYRVSVDRLRRLERPIPSLRLRRIVFIPTSFGRMLRATEINDLYRDSPIEDALYFRMKDSGINSERQFFVRDSGSGHMLDIALFCRDGQVDVECDGERYHSGRDRAAADRARDNRLTAAGWRVLRFSGHEILSKTDACLATIGRTIGRLGGPEPMPAPRCRRHAHSLKRSQT